MADKPGSVFDIKRKEYAILLHLENGDYIHKKGKFSENEIASECRRLAQGFTEKRDDGAIIYYNQNFIRWIRADKVENIISESQGKASPATNQGQTP